MELLRFLAGCFCVDGSLLQSGRSPTPQVLPVLGKEFGGYSHFLIVDIKQWLKKTKHGF